jgi:hypothetical protein
MNPVDLRFVLFHTRSCGSRLQGKLFWIFGQPAVIIGFYRLGVYLWNPFTGDSYAMRFWRFKKELKKRTLPA